MIELDKVVEHEKTNAMCEFCPDVQACMEYHIEMNGVDNDVPVRCLREPPAEYTELDKAKYEPEEK